LGRHDVDGLLAELSSQQLAEWLAYFQLEPWGLAQEVVVVLLA